jgi:hypothetical protein
MSREDDLFEPVLAALRADPTSEFGSPDARIDTLHHVRGPFSSVRRVRVQTPSRTTYAYIKILKPRKPGAEELAMIDRMLLREYRATRALHDALPQDPAIGAVRPIALLPEFRALATEEVPGRPWGEVLARGGVPDDELLGIARRVGAWVRTYQRIGAAPAAIEVAERRTYIDDRLRLLEGRAIGARERQAALDRFDRIARDIGSPSVPAVPIHADLTPMNIVVDGRGRVTVLDFTMAKTGTALHDLSHVYFHLELMAGRHRRRRAAFRGMQREMLRGYDPGLSAADPLFRLMLMQHGVCHVALLAERRVPVLDPLYRWFLRRRWRLCDRLSA